MIYFDNAATTLHKPQEVREAVYNAMDHAGNATRGAHKAALDALRIVEAARMELAGLFHFPFPQNVVFTLNATESLNLVIQGLFQEGEHIVTTACEHNSVLRPLYLLEEQGKIELSIVQGDDRGVVKSSELENTIKDNTRAIICNHASNLTGNITDLYEIGRICRRHGIYLVVDAAQTAGIIPIDMESMNIDVLCFTGHKGLLGPQGTGGLCVGKNVSIRPIIVGGSGIHSYDREHPHKLPASLEAGTLNAHGIAGLLAAVRYINSIGMNHIYEREALLAKRFYEGIRDLPGIKIYGDYSAACRIPIVAINIGDYDSGQISSELWERFEIATRPGAHCAPLLHHMLGTDKQGAVRFSFSHYNTEEEIDQGISALKILVSE